MKWIIDIIVFLALTLVIVVIIGTSLPLVHVASRTTSFKQQPETIWRAITDYAGQRQWRDLKDVEILPDIAAHYKDYSYGQSQRSKIT